jgi:small subunit ribosomal protein S20
LRTAVKKARAAVDGKAADASALVKTAVSIIDGAVTKGILKRQTASRYVSRLSTRTPSEAVSASK